MATNMQQVASAGGSPRHSELRQSRQSKHVSGQLIIRFKTSAVRQVAASPRAATATARMAAQAMPDEVAGPAQTAAQPGRAFRRQAAVRHRHADTRSATRCDGACRHPWCTCEIIDPRAKEIADRISSLSTSRTRT